jgi:hypothetical protein
MYACQSNVFRSRFNYCLGICQEKLILTTKFLIQCSWSTATVSELPFSHIVQIVLITLLPVSLPIRTVTCYGWVVVWPITLRGFRLDNRFIHYDDYNYTDYNYCEHISTWSFLNLADGAAPPWRLTSRAEHFWLRRPTDDDSRTHWHRLLPLPKTNFEDRPA